MLIDFRLVAWSALLLAAVGLRCWGLGFGSPPTMIHPDEIHYAEIAERLSLDDLNPRYFENPPLLTYVLFAAREVHALCTSAETHRRWIEDGGLYLVGRWIGVLLGSATVLLVGAAAKALLGSPGAGLAAGAVVAFSFLHGRDSHYGVNDVPMVALVALSLLAAVRAHREGSSRWLGASALAAGLAAAMKYSGGIAIALPLAVVILGRAPPAARLLQAAGALLLAEVVFLLANLWALLDVPAFRDGFVNQWRGWGDSRAVGQAERPGLALYGEATIAMLGWAHAGAAALGLVLLARRDRRAALLLLSAPALYLVVMLDKALFYWRFALPLLPFLAIAAATAWQGIARRLAPARPAAALTVLVGLASAQPAVALARHDWLASRPATWMLAREWILDHVPEGDVVSLVGFAPDLPPGRYARTLSDANLAKLAALGRAGLDGQRDAAISQGAWIATDGWYDTSWEHVARGPPLFRRLREALTPVVEFAPGPNGDPPFILDAIYSPLTDLWAVDRPGFTIRVYRVEPSDWERLLGP